jgi:hypothetical protein
MPVGFGLILGVACGPRMGLMGQKSRLRPCQRMLTCQVGRSRWAKGRLKGLLRLC